jgi:hypothetical protein
MRALTTRLLVVLSVLVVAACGPTAPDRIAIVGNAVIHATEVGKTESLGVSAFHGLTPIDDRKAPLAVTWTSSDTSVATVDAAGLVTSTGSGKATITASVPGADDKAVSAIAVVENVIVSTVEATGAFPKKFTLNSPPVQLTVVVKDDKGNVVEHPKLKFRATDYCVDVSADGLVRPLAVGDCKVVVESGSKAAKIELDVLE